MLTRQQRRLIMQLEHDNLVLSRLARAGRSAFRPTPKRPIGDMSADEILGRVWALLPRLIRSARRGRRLADAGYVAGVVRGIATGLPSEVR